jgi:hypothetical protein
VKRDLVRVGNPGAPALRRALSPAQFGDLAGIPPELEWLANLTNPKTRRAYKIDVEEFIAFAALRDLTEGSPNGYVVTKASGLARFVHKLRKLNGQLYREFATGAQACLPQLDPN